MLKKASFWNSLNLCSFVLYPTSRWTMTVNVFNSQKLVQKVTFIDSELLNIRVCPFVWLFLTGESALHIAIVNEDPALVKFLLDSGADVHERCVGNFMCPEDQKASRSDSLDHEWVCVTPETNYNG